MQAPALSILWTLLLVTSVQLTHSSDSTPCEACKAWEELEQVYNSTGNLTDVGQNKTVGGGDGSHPGDMNHTARHNVTIPYPTNKQVPGPSGSTPPPSSPAPQDYPMTVKTTAATLAIAIALLAL